MLGLEILSAIAALVWLGLCMFLLFIPGDLAPALVYCGLPGLLSVVLYGLIRGKRLELARFPKK